MTKVVHVRLVIGRLRVPSLGALISVDITSVIGVLDQLSGCALAALATLLRFARETVGLLALGRRQRGIVRRLGRLALVHLQFRYACLQNRNLSRHRQNEINQIFLIQRSSTVAKNGGE